MKKVYFNGPFYKSPSLLINTQIIIKILLKQFSPMFNMLFCFGVRCEANILAFWTTEYWENLRGPNLIPVSTG